MTLKPYYSEAGITIYHGDCREILPLLTADLLAFDPPYGTNEHGGYGRRQLGLEVIDNDDDTTVRDAVLALWGERPGICFASPRRAVPPGRWDYRLVWDKRSPGLGAPWRWQHEEVWLRGKWSNHPGTPSVLSFSPDREMRKRWHPHEKPVPLMVALLQGASGIIVDPTMGSGSTLRAARDLGRQAIGIETNERHCASAVLRLQQEVLFGS